MVEPAAIMDIVVQIFKTTWTLGTLIGELLAAVINLATGTVGITIPPVVFNIIIEGIGLFAVVYALKKSAGIIYIVIILLIMFMIFGGIINALGWL